LLTLSLNSDKLFGTTKKGDAVNQTDDDKPEPPADKSKELLKIISTQELFGEEREICIEHGAERYVLRITRRGKLILQK